MRKYLMATLLLSMLFLGFSDASAQSAIQKKDHLLTAGVRLEYMQNNDNRNLAVGMSIEWQYLITEKWALGIGLQLDKLIYHSSFPFSNGSKLREDYIIAPALIASRVYSINEKWSFALANTISYYKRSNQFIVGYGFNPELYFKFRPHWLISASTTLGGMSYSKNWEGGESSYFGVSLRPRINNLAPSFSISYLL